MAEASPFRICLVCTGNTCRSPMSEGILKVLAAEHGIRNWRIESGGLSAFAGAPASPGSVTAAFEAGVDLRAHRASLFTPERATQCDLILVHSGEHYHHVLHWGDHLQSKTFLLKFFPAPGDPGPAMWVADPIGLDLAAYRETFQELKVALRGIVPDIQHWAAKESD